MGRLSSSECTHHEWFSGQNPATQQLRGVGADEGGVAARVTHDPHAARALQTGGVHLGRLHEDHLALLRGSAACRCHCDRLSRWRAVSRPAAGRSCHSRRPVTHQRVVSAVADRTARSALATVRCPVGWWLQTPEAPASAHHPLSSLGRREIPRLSALLRRMREPTKYTALLDGRRQRCCRAEEPVMRWWRRVTAGTGAFGPGAFNPSRGISTHLK